ncbi:MAG: TlpA disulfide reductase family protein [Phycisphaerales bacterium]|nr:TlpA disulfide reductase family protein [Phycisphaerales bacterium]
MKFRKVWLILVLICVASIAVIYARTQNDDVATQALPYSDVPAVGTVAPNFTQNDINGNPVSLSSFRGKYVLLDFWASWCGPCRMENPNVVEAYKKFHSDKFTIIGVSLDKSKDAWKSAVTTDGIQWTQVSDLQFWRNAVAVLYNINSIPMNFLINPEGVIIAENLRGDELERTLANTLK